MRRRFFMRAISSQVFELCDAVRMGAGRPARFATLSAGLALIATDFMLI